MSPDLRDVAAGAGVSIGTVSNFLNKPQLVAPATKARIEKVIDRLGYVPNASARNLRSGHSRTLGLIVPDIANPFFTEVARGVEDKASSRDYGVFLCNTDENHEKEEHYLTLLLEQRVRGILITPKGDQTRRIEAIQNRGISVILLDHETSQKSQCSVSVDDLYGGEIATQHLIDLGHENIIMVTGPDSLQQCVDRAEGTSKTARKYGIRVPQLRVESMNIQGGVEAGEKILELPKRPTGVFCANDLLALGVMRALQGAGIKIPEEISIIGYDDIDFASSASVALTSVQQPAYQLGKVATELLMSEFETPDDHAHQQILFQPQLVVRSSTAAR